MNRFTLKLGAVFLISTLFVLMVAGLAEASVTYTVQSGDSLYLISNRYGVTVPQLKSANGLTSNAIYPGQKLAIPGGATTGTGYTVVRGDTLYLISKRFGVSVNTIRQANNIWTDVVYPGQVLSIPGADSRPVTTVSRDFSRSDMTLLAKAVFAEARGEVYEGQVAVAAVILNRLKNPNFPKTIPGIIYDPGAFSAVDDGQINLWPDQTAFNAVQDAINGWDPTYGALYYWNPAKTSNSWVWSRTITAKIGNHIFAK